MLRAEKTTRNHDDFKVLVAGTVIAIMLMVGQTFIPQLSENRWYRDLVGLTPFKNVYLIESEVIEGGKSLMVQGSMIKVRCKFVSMDAYVIDNKGFSYRLNVNTKIEDGIVNPGNRVPSPNEQAWGPWILDISTRDGIQPVEFVINVRHACPSEPKDQENIFIKGLWGKYILFDKT